MSKAMLFGAPIPVTLVIVSFLAPMELSLFLAGLRLPLHRLSLLIALPFALAAFASGKAKVRSYDILFLCFAAWTSFVFTYHNGYQGFIYGGSIALEGFGSFIVARAFIRTHEQFLASFRVLMCVVAAAGLIALPETLLGKNFTHDYLQRLTGYVVQRGIDVRHGLTRAYGTFDHPIHLGVFAASVLSLAVYTSSNTMQMWQRVAVVLVATLTAVSSAPFLCIALQVAMIGWERLSRGMAGRVIFTVSVIVGLYIGASMVMERSPINFIATVMTLNAWTGFYRLLIWEWGLFNVWNNLWLGLGGESDWVRAPWMASKTVDALWLVIMMQQGVPAIVLLGLAIILLARGVSKRVARTRSIAEKRIGRAWMMSLIALALLACTVHLWNAVYAYLFFLLGSAAWLADPARVSAKASRKASANHASRCATRKPERVDGGPKRPSTPDPYQWPDWQPDPPTPRPAFA